VKRHPLRRIVGHEREDLAPGVERVVEVLECGHRSHIKSDFRGKTHPARRRCWQCSKS